MATHPKYQGETDITLGQISGVYDARNFCERLISTVNIAMAYCEDLDAWEEQQRVGGVISNVRHSTVTPEEVVRKWNRVGNGEENFESHDTVWDMHGSTSDDTSLTG